MGQRVALLPTCVVDSVASDVGASVVRVLRKCGLEVSVPDGATCCGQPAWNSGFADQAAMVARQTLDALESDDAETICVPAGSCATMIRVFWPELFHVTGDHASQKRAEALAPRVKEFSELVADHADKFSPADNSKRVAYHHSCHMLRELRIHAQPEALVDQRGHERVQWASDERCCGFGGLFSIKQPETSVAMADDKIDSMQSAGAQMLVGCDQSCLLHLTGRLRHRGSNMPVRHLAQILDDTPDR